MAKPGSLFAVTLAILMACTPSAAEQSQTLPAGAYIYRGDDAADLLDQCSRSTPAPGDSYFTPSAADIVAFEAALPEALRASGETPDGYRPESERQGWSNLVDRWVRQYIGIVRDGTETIYGNFFPREMVTRHPENDFSRSTMIVCDGGRSFFGAEFNPASGQIVHLAFNGFA